MKYEVHFANGSRVETATLVAARKVATDADAACLPAHIWLRDVRLVGEARLIEVYREERFEPHLKRAKGADGLLRPVPGGERVVAATLDEASIVAASFPDD